MNPTRRFSSLQRFSANLIGTWRRQVSGQRKVIVVVNPATGQDHPILKTTNSIFQPAGIPALLASPPGCRKDLLDVIIIRKIDVTSQLIGSELNLLKIIAAELTGSNGFDNHLLHWQARQLRISANPPQPVQVLVPGQTQASAPAQIP
jgi:hypothetical protein